MYCLSLRMLLLSGIISCLRYCLIHHLCLHVYLDEKLEPLSWELRVQIALDVARGLEYLHDGVSWITKSYALTNNSLLCLCSCLQPWLSFIPCYSTCLCPFFSGCFCNCLQAVPSVTHRDIKSSNILLDESMRARVIFCQYPHHSSEKMCKILKSF